jgi:hypothetical protein
MAQLQIPHFTFCLQNESARRSDLHQNCHQCVKSHCPLNYHQGECERCRRKDRHASATKRSSLGTANAKIIKNHPKPQNFGDLSVSFCLLVLVFHWTLWQFGRRGAPPDSVALQGSWHSARMATALAAAGGWASAMLRHGVTPKPFLPHTH